MLASEDGQEETKDVRALKLLFEAPVVALLETLA